MQYILTEIVSQNLHILSCEPPYISATPPHRTETTFACFLTNKNWNLVKMIYWHHVFINKLQNQFILNVRYTATLDLLRPHPPRPLEISNIYLLPFPAPWCCLLWCFVTSVLKLLRYTERMKIPFPFSTLDLNWKFMFAFFSFCSHRFWYNRVTLVPNTAQIYEYMVNLVQERYI